MAVTIYTSDFILYKLRTIVVQINCIKTLKNRYGRFSFNILFTN